MSFFTSQDKELQERYKKMLSIMGSLSNLFSESDKPYMDSRVTENLFCSCLVAENLARKDCTADAKKDDIGIGIKTWVGHGMQKIAEFDKLRPEYKNLPPEELVQKISNYRNERIGFTMRAYNLSQMIYHCIVREKGLILIKECPLELIVTSDITIENSGTERKGTIRFTDGKNEYSFNESKSVLLQRFDKMNEVDNVHVDIIPSPFEFLEKVFAELQAKEKIESAGNPSHPFVILRLYSYSKKKGKFVPERSGLNQWNAKGRARDMDEMYIPISHKDNLKNQGFFPKRDTPFTLQLPNGNGMKAKICQENDKALMSNPNKALGKWLLRDVLHIQEGKLLTYRNFEEIGIDSVMVEKLQEGIYRIDFAKIGSYEAYMGKDVFDDDEVDKSE